MKITEMNEIIYVPIYIDGKEENLPGDDGYYFISTGDKYDRNYDVFHFTKVNARQNKLDWMEHVIFWLKPAHIATVIEKRIVDKMVSEREYTAQHIDLAYTTGVFNVVGIDGLGKELKRLKAIDKKPHDIFRIRTEGGQQ